MLSRKLSKPRNSEKGFTLIELIIVIVILGIIAGVAIPKFVGLSDQARLSAARGVGAALSGTIASKHATYLLNSSATYAIGNIVNDTQYAGGVAPTVNGNSIDFVSGPQTYTWDYNAVSGDESAYLTENNSSNFP